MQYDKQNLWITFHLFFTCIHNCCWANDMGLMKDDQPFAMRRTGMGSLWRPHWSRCASIIAAVRLARDDISAPTPRLLSTVANSVSLARLILKRVVGS